MSKVKRVQYFTKEKKDLINPENRKIYDKYLNSSIIKNRDVKDTTYKVYKNYMDHFLVYLSENWDNISLYSDEFMEDAIDIMEGYISFLQDTLLNNKKVINTKISTVSTFFFWSIKRGYVEKHPFDKKLDRMKGANEEKIISSYFLNESEMSLITEGLTDDTKYDIQDRIIWGVMIDSANRVGAIEKLTLSSLDMNDMAFTDIREKRGNRVEVVFEENTLSLVKEWLERRKDIDNLEVDSLLITKRNGKYKPMTKNTIQARVKKMGYILGLTDFRSHCIRKTSLNHIYETTGNLALAAEMGNHKSVETTRQSYIKPESKTNVRAKIAQLKKENKNKKDN